MMMKTDKSVHAMWGISFVPRVETRGYHESLRDQAQLNPLIHQWDRPTRACNLSSVLTDYSYLKTDKSVRWIGWGVYNPRVKTRGYPMPIVNRVRVNPLIHQWDRPTRTYNLSSVSTDYS